MVQPKPLSRLEEAKRALKEKLEAVALGSRPDFEDLARALGHVHLSVPNRLLVGAQLPKAREVRPRDGWERTGYRLKPGARGAVVLAPAREGGFTERVLFSEEHVEPEYIPAPLPPEEHLPAVARFLVLEEDAPAGMRAAFLRSALRLAAAALPLPRGVHAKRAFFHGAALALEGMMRWEGLVRPIGEEDLRLAFAKDPKAADRLLRLVGQAATAVAEAVGLFRKGARREGA